MRQTRSWISALAAILALAPPLAPAAGGTAGDTFLATRILVDHNRERALVGVPPLSWSEPLARDAAAWAQHLAGIGHLVHSPDDPGDPDPEGENLWAGTSGAYDADAMVDLWAAEKRNYRRAAIPDASRTGDFEDVGHYTQMVWRTTRHVGCAMARGDRDDFLVCRYAEGGNVIGEQAF